MAADVSEVSVTKYERTYWGGNKFAYSVAYFFESLLSIFELSKKSRQKGFRSIHIVLSRVMAIHTMLVIRIALDIKNVPLMHCQKCLYLQQ
jgi:hypothetical protein